MKTWTKALTIVGQVIGMMTGISPPYYYGLNSIADFAYLLGVGIPFAIIGLLVGLGIDYFFKPNEEIEKTHTNNIEKKYESNEITKIKNKSLSSPTIKKYDSMEDAYSQVSNENTISKKEKELIKVVPNNFEEEKIWELVAEEFDSVGRKKGLYAKLFADMDGDEKQIKIAYYKIRVEEIKSNK